MGRLRDFIYRTGMTPFRMRLFVVAFLALAAATSFNAIYMQEAPRRTAAAVKVASPPGDGEERPGAATASLSGEEAAPGAAGESAAAAAARKIMEAQKPDPLPAPNPRVKAIQRELASRGYRPGGRDGVLTPQTRAAILACEFDERMPLTGEPTEAVLKALIFAKAAGKTKAGAPDRFEHRGEVVKQVQQMLAQLGYTAGPIDGRVDDRMREAIRRFETDRRLKPGGRLTSRVLLEMVIVAGKPFAASS